MRFRSVVPIILAVFALWLVSCSKPKLSDRVQESLVELDGYVASRPVYETRKRGQLDALRMLLQSSTDPVRRFDLSKELADEYPERAAGTRPQTPDLLSWADQGVLLLNATLTVAAGRAGSHQGRGWETFTDAVVRRLAEARENLVFLLWGSYAQRKGAVIDRSRHLVLTSAHPSPLSATRGFFGCNHFRSANDYLASHGMPPIRW